MQLLSRQRSLGAAAPSGVARRASRRATVLACAASGDGIGRRSMLAAGTASLVLGSHLPAGGASAGPDPAGSIYDLTALQFGKPVSLSKYRGQVLVVVNIASE